MPVFFGLSMSKSRTNKQISSSLPKTLMSIHNRSEVRMRRHASKQNSVPNNLRTMPPPTTANNLPATPAAALAASTSTHQNRLSITSLDAPTSSQATPSNVNPKITTTTRVKDQRDAKAKRNEWRITKMVLAIFLSFVMCYLPITVIKVADKDVEHPGAHIFGYIMLYLSSCINPIIYVIMNKQYRQAYKTVILCKPARLLAFTQGGGSSVGGK